MRRYRKKRRQDLRENIEMGVRKSTKKSTMRGDGCRVVESIGRGAGVHETQKRRERSAKGVVEAESQRLGHLTWREHENGLGR